MRIELSHRDLMEILSTVKHWNRKHLTQENFRKIQQETGIPARLVEITFWHFDTLGVLSAYDWLVFKGGTCVQTYLPSGLQRSSVDLDFNSGIENPNSIKEEIRNLNKIILEMGGSVNIEGIEFGSLELKADDIHSGTLNFNRRMPSRFGELEKIGENSIPAKSVRIQINYKHSWLPALEIVKKEPRFFILDHQRPNIKFKLNHSSAEDLVVDKVLATSMIGSFGRERFKDVYDLGMLLKNNLRNSIIHKKMGLIGRRSHIEPIAFIKGSIETISSFSANSQEVLGFAAMIGRKGREAIKDWEEFCISIIEKLKELGDLFK